MTAADIPVLQALAVVATLSLAVLCAWRGRNSHRAGRTAKILAGIATILALFVPLDGPPLWNRVFSFYANPCLPMLGIVCTGVWARLLGLHIFRPADWQGIWIFGASAGTALYLHAIVLGNFDLYYWGWDRRVSAILLGTLAVVSLACGNRLGVLLLAGLVSYAVTALESHNCWDYIVDPLYWVTSLGVLAVQPVLALRRRRTVGLPVALVLPALPPEPTAALQPNAERSVAIEP
jgi:hypothetical protein